MQWSGVFRFFIFLTSYTIFYIVVGCLFVLFTIRALSVRIYRRESNSSIDFSGLSKIGHNLSVEHEISFTITILSLYFISFICALIMNSSSIHLSIPYPMYIDLMYSGFIMVLMSLFLFWFYISKPLKARINAARITWGGWLGLYHRMDDRYEYMRFEINKLLSKLESPNEKASDVSYRTLELVLQNKGDNGCAARAALMDLDPYLWSDYQESLCDRSRSFSYSMVLAMCGTIILVSGFIPRAVGITYMGDYFFFSIAGASFVYWITIMSYLFEYRRERIKDNFTPKVCYEPTIDRRFWKRNSKPHL